jgi:multicomponent Na+:H+ antiporter subunit G
VDFLVDALSWVFLSAGAVFCVIGGIGLLRMPGFYSRTHASGLIDTMGAGLILLGLAFQSGFSEVTIKLLIVLVFLFVTSPTAAHALVNGAYTQGLKPVLDDDEKGGAS